MPGKAQLPHNAGRRARNGNQQGLSVAEAAVISWTTGQRQTKGRRRRAGPKSAGFVVEATPVPADDGVVAAAIVPVNEAACGKPLPQRR